MNLYKEVILSVVAASVVLAPLELARISNKRTADTIGDNLQLTDEEKRAWILIQKALQREQKRIQSEHGWKSELITTTPIVETGSFLWKWSAGTSLDKYAEHTQ